MGAIEGPLAEEDGAGGIEEEAGGIGAEGGEAVRVLVAAKRPTHGGALSGLPLVPGILAHGGAHAGFEEADLDEGPVDLSVLGGSGGA